MTARGIRGPRRALVFAVIGVVYLGAQWMREGRIRFGDLVLWPRDQVVAGSASPQTQSARSGTIERLFEQGRSDVVVQFRGDVDRVLPDDNEGSRHQRFILELASGHTVLVAHNLDLARRVPLTRGDSVEVKGEYEWNQRGGVVHWTHRDPQRRRDGGWIQHRGEIYQ